MRPGQASHEYYTPRLTICQAARQKKQRACQGRRSRRRLVLDKSATIGSAAGKCGLLLAIKKRGGSCRRQRGAAPRLKASRLPEAPSGGGGDGRGAGEKLQLWTRLG